MTTFSLPDRYLIGIIIILLCVALCSHLDVMPLRAEEPRRALVAYEMELHGNYFTPTINGEFYYNKPPVYNWLLIVLYKIFRSHEEWVVRLPSVLSVLGTALFLYLFVGHYLGRRVGLLSALFYATSADILFYFSLLGEIDLFYSLLVILQIAAVFYGFMHKKYGWLFVVSYFLCTLGLLTKGLPSIVFEVLTLLALSLYSRQWKLLFHPLHFVGAGMMCVLVGAFFWQYSHYNDPYIYMAKLFSESSERTVMEKSYTQSITHLFLFPLSVLKLLLPYIMLLPFWWHKEARKQVRENPILWLSVLFIAANIWIYWLSPGTKDRYLYMFLPFFFLLLAYGYEQFGAQMPRTKRAVEISIGIVIGLVTGLVAVVSYLPQTAGVQMIGLKSAIFMLLFCALLYIYIRGYFSRILLLVLATVLMRMAMNVMILPAQKTDFETNAVLKDLDTILNITQKQPIYFTGEAWKYHVESFKIGGTPLVQIDFRQPPPLLFRISYYLTRGTRHIVTFTEEAAKGRYYLADKNFADKQNHITVLHNFKEPRNNIDYVLFKYE